MKQKPLPERAVNSISESKVLFLLNEKPITQAELEKINPDKIESVKVIKNKKEIAEYTSDEYDGVIIIEMKKTE